MRIYIPTTESILTLSSDWEFKLHCEYRNSSLLDAFVLPKLKFQDQAYWDQIQDGLPLGHGTRTYSWDETILYRAMTGDQRGRGIGFTTSTVGMDKLFNPRVILPTGTTLKVDRIYLRKAMHEYDSLTFVIKDTPLPSLQGKKKLRFWAKLDDVNQMDVVDPYS